MTTQFSRLIAGVLSVLLLLSLTLGLTGCGKPEDADIIARAKELIPKTEVINQLFFEEGIPTRQEEPQNGYIPADANRLEAMGFTKIDDIFRYMEEVYTKEFCEIFKNSYLFEPLYSGGSIVSYSYCYDHYEKDKNGNDVFVGVMVSAFGLDPQTSPVVYHYDTLTVKEKAKKRCVLTMDVTVTSENNSQTKPLKVVLTRDSDGVWRLDSHTCATYFDATQS